MAGSGYKISVFRFLPNIYDGVFSKIVLSQIFGRVLNTTTYIMSTFEAILKTIEKQFTPFKTRDVFRDKSNI